MAHVHTNIDDFMLDPAGIAGVNDELNAAIARNGVPKGVTPHKFTGGLAELIEQLADKGHRGLPGLWKQ